MRVAGKILMPIILMTIWAVIMTTAVDVQAKGKVRKSSCTVYQGKMKKWSDPLMIQAKKVKMKSSNKKIVKVSRKKGNVLLKGRKIGKAKVMLTIISKKGRKNRFLIKVFVKDEEKVVKAKAKKAFAIQNQYRKQKGSASLRWSEELYRFAQYRIKTSGFDGHKNLDKDRKKFFGKFVENNPFDLGENIHLGSTTAKGAMQSWKNSKGHYQNLLRKEYVCGAIATYGDLWCAIFMETTFKEIRSSEKVKVILKRYNTATGAYVSGSKFMYYEENDKWGTQKAVVITEASGKAVFLEIGKTYVIYEKTSPDGCGKAEKVTVTITRDGAKEIILSG